MGTRTTTKGKSQPNTLIDSFLNTVERGGNLLPDPFTLFFILSVALVVISALLSYLGVSVVHPGTKETISVSNLLSYPFLQKMLVELPKNFTSFPPLGTVLVAMIGIGVAERCGLITSVLRGIVTKVPSFLLPAAVVFAGIQSNIASDAGYVVLTPLGAVLFYAFGRHPIAGLAAAFAGVSGGFSANFLMSALDPLLAGISTTAAKIVDPNYIVHAPANYYFMVASTVLLVLVGTFVTTHIVEPRLGKYQGEAASQTEQLTAAEQKGLKYFFWYTLFFVGLLLFLTVPETAILKDAKTGLAPFYSAIVALIMIYFLVGSIIYGAATGTIKNDKDVAKLATQSMSGMGSYILLAFMCAQFVEYFKWSNLGIIIGISGASFLTSTGLTGIPMMLLFILVCSFINLFMGSASAKWAILGPVFIPMFMLMGYSPELVQNAYRIGDSITNIISPLLPYFPIILAFANKYDPKAGMGTLISTMLPYTISFGLMWGILFIVWYSLGLPLGPEVPMFYHP